jgi:hypothetical protein
LIKASGSISERSTWVSAAKLTMVSISWVLHHRLHGCGVGNVAADKGVAPAKPLLDVLEVVQVAGVGQLVKHDNPIAG